MNRQSSTQPAQVALSRPVIFHPTDFSHGSAPALAHAVALAYTTGAHLTMLHILNAHDNGVARNGLIPVADLLLRWRLLKPSERYAELQPLLGFSLDCINIPSRSAAEGVAEHFADHPADLAVLMSREHAGLSYWFSGSVSRRLLRRADMMILFLREGARGFVDTQTGQVRLSRVLIPVNGSIPVAGALTRAMGMIDRLGAVEKRLLHIGDRPPSDCPKDIPMTFAQGPVVETILQVAQSYRSDLIIIPTAGKRGMLGVFRGSITSQILDDPRFPVLSVPAI